MATLSRRARDRIEAAFEQSVDGSASNPLLGSRLHDFGFRGCTCVEQSVIGGVAHLLNFDGSDTLSAAYYAQVRLEFFAWQQSACLMATLCSCVSRNSHPISTMPLCMFCIQSNTLMHFLPVSRAFPLLLVGDGRQRTVSYDIAQ